ncbi:MAG: MOSC domain-containing protein [Candidatus Eisenbacteria bacterium]
MRIPIGTLEALWRYPVKSMRGEPLEAAELGWHGLEGDRRLAFRRPEERGGFPWLTATRLPELLLFTPLRREPADARGLPSHVRTPEGAELEMFGEPLAADVGRRLGAPVELVHLNRGIFDEASVSLLTTTTVGALATMATHAPDVRRFRPNVVIASARAVEFEEDEWLNGVLSFGDATDAAAVYVTNRDERCAMVNYDPDTGAASPGVLKAIVRQRDNRAGAYGTVARRGRLAVGQPVYFERTD